MREGGELFSYITIRSSNCVDYEDSEPVWQHGTVTQCFLNLKYQCVGLETSSGEAAECNQLNPEW